MVGGTVVEIIEQPDHLVLEVADMPYGKVERLCVKIPKGWCVEFGDQVWWQAGYVYWSPVGQLRKDVPIPKIGSSFRTKE